MDFIVSNWRHFNWGGIGFAVLMGVLVPLSAWLTERIGRERRHKLDDLREDGPYDYKYIHLNKETGETSPATPQTTLYFSGAFQDALSKVVRRNPGDFVPEPLAMPLPDPSREPAMFMFNRLPVERTGIADLRNSVQQSAEEDPVYARMVMQAGPSPQLPRSDERDEVLIYRRAAIDSSNYKTPGHVCTIDRERSDLTVLADGAILAKCCVAGCETVVLIGHNVANAIIAEKGVLQ